MHIFLLLPSEYLSLNYVLHSCWLYGLIPLCNADKHPISWIVTNKTLTTSHNEVLLTFTKQEAGKKKKKKKKAGKSQFVPREMGRVNR